MIMPLNDIFIVIGFQVIGSTEGWIHTFHIVMTMLEQDYTVKSNCTFTKIHVIFGREFTLYLSVFL